jgi:mono/diheme cytochrome c family protein
MVMHVIVPVVLLMQAVIPPLPTAVKPEAVAIEKTEYDVKELGANREAAERTSEAPGKKLFVSRCALCHDPRGQSAMPGRTLGPWLDAALVKAKGEEAIRNYILNGSTAMPGFRYQFGPDRVDQIIAYLKSVPPEARPKL